MNYRDYIFKTIGEKGIIRTRDIEKIGIPREYLLRLLKKGELERIGRGLYSLPDRPVSELISLVEVATKYPHTVVCLLSALNLHEITTQRPFEVWLAIERGKWKPKHDLSST
ncbi:MAG: type IV toxin-antitoxin system AbiEi family antitoxin domain-containing protein [Proteobacteria bacterium]|nr:type IV toxin-antitoxin system AbiEi family antitoxin domain-containing protein [Pseudomonadota bacterium]